MVTSVTRVPQNRNGHDFIYWDYYGLSTDVKPTTAVFNGSTFLEEEVDEQGVQTGKWSIYIFNATAMRWDFFVSWTND